MGDIHIQQGHTPGLNLYIYTSNILYSMTLN